MTDTIFSRTWQEITPSLVNKYQKKSSSELSCLIEDSENGHFFTELISLFNSAEDLPVLQLKKYNLPVILDYLEKTHCFYLEKKLLEIEQAIGHVEKSFPQNNLIPYLGSFFAWVKENLTFHIKMEEEQLFPYIKSLYQEQKQVSSFTIQHFINSHTDNIEFQISEVKKHIIRAQDGVKDQFSFGVLLRHLSDFEKDLRIHGKIEDDVLIPMALELEKEMKIRTS